MKILELIIVQLCSENVTVFGILLHSSFEHVKVENLFGPNIISDIIVNISKVGKVGMLLLLSPFFIEGFSKLYKSFLKIFEVFVEIGEHEIKVPF